MRGAIAEGFFAGVPGPLRVETLRRLDDGLGAVLTTQGASKVGPWESASPLAHQTAKASACTCPTVEAPWLTTAIRQWRIPLG